MVRNRNWDRNISDLNVGEIIAQMDGGGKRVARAGCHCEAANYAAEAIPNVAVGDCFAPRILSRVVSERSGDAT